MSLFAQFAQRTLSVLCDLSLRSAGQNDDPVSLSYSMDCNV